MTAAYPIRVGDRFAKLVVLDAIEIEGVGTMPAGRFMCRCDCGGRIIVEGRRLRSAAVKRCAACRPLAVATAAEAFGKPGKARRCALESCGRPVGPDRRASHEKVHCSDDCAHASYKLRHNKYSAKWYRDNLIHSLTYAAFWREANRDKQSAYARQYYRAHREQVLRRGRRAREKA